MVGILLCNGSLRSAPPCLVLSCPAPSTLSDPPLFLSSSGHIYISSIRKKIVEDAAYWALPATRAPTNPAK